MKAKASKRELAVRARFKPTRGPNKYRVDVSWSEEDQAYIARVPELPGCSTHGDTGPEAVENAEEAIELYVESLIARGIEPPTPLAERSFSGRIPLRIDPNLHRDLTLEADRENLSLNKLIMRKLSRES